MQHEIGLLVRGRLLARLRAGKKKGGPEGPPV